MGDHIPGLLIPIAFLSSLRANLQISILPDDTVYSSDPMNGWPPENLLDTSCIPQILSSSQEKLNSIAPVPRRLSSQFDKNFDTASCSTGTVVSRKPGISVSPTQSEDEVQAALLLLSDSVAHQRQLAIRTILLHPSVLATGILFFLSSAKMIYSGSLADVIFILSVWTLGVLGLFLFIRSMVGGYQNAIQRSRHATWLFENSVHGLSHKRDEVFIARNPTTESGEGRGDIVGVLVMRICKTVTDSGAQGVRPRSTRRKSSARWTGIIRAWAVKQSARSNGVGTSLLEEAITSCRLRNLDGPIFADDHAHSHRISSQVFNSGFDKHDAWAREFLEYTIAKESNK